MNDPRAETTDVGDIDVLQYVRATILVIGRDGTILQVHGGAGRPLGYRPEDLEGESALEFIASEDHPAMANQFLASNDLPFVAIPQAFPLHITGPDGITRVWDCVPAGFSEGGIEGWVTTMTCRQEQDVSIDAMEHFLQGGTALEIAAVVAERLQQTSDGGWRTNALVLHRHPTQSDSTPPGWQLLPPAPGTETVLSRALAACLDHVDAPWHMFRPGDSESVARLPPALRAAADNAGLPHCTAVSIGTDEETRIVFLRFSNYPRELQGNNRLADQAIDAVLRRALGAERSRMMLDHAMRSDPLTGISNRFHFDEVLDADDRSAQAALFVDIDNFKVVNDTFGHAVGDIALREVAARIVRSCRPQDLVARIGGDEFAVILRNVSKAEVDEIADRIRSEMANPLDTGSGLQTISVTVGSASPAPGVSLTELVRRADHAMLAAKSSARHTTI